MTPAEPERDAPSTDVTESPWTGAADVGRVGTVGRAAERRGVSERRARDRRVMAVVEEMSDAFLALDPHWRITYANREAARLQGVGVSALVGQDHWALWPETLGTAVEAAYRRVMADRTPASLEHHYPRADVWHEIRAYPADDGGIAVFYRDVTARKQLEAERVEQARALAAAHDKAMAAEAQFRLLVEHVRDYAVFLLDADGRISQWGPGAERLKGWTRDEVVGRHLRSLYPPGDTSEDGSADEHLEHARRYGEYIGVGTRMRRDGSRYPARVVLTALREGGHLVGFSKITQDLTPDRERAAVVQHAMSLAESASTAKSQFLANTSHEIRTPLNAIIGYAELLDLGLAGALGATQRKYVARIQTTSRHLLSLVNDVLDLSKIESGQMRTRHEPGMVREVVAAALELVEPQARSRRTTLVNACNEHAAAAYRGDVERVRQILVNLLANAVRFTEIGGRVTVTCGVADRAPDDVVVSFAPRDAAWAFVRVEDTGVGISPAELEHIWEAFVQVDASRTRTFGGSGLGLTISRHLARLMGGDITVRSEPGLGSSFVLWLPAADAAEVAPPRRRWPMQAELTSPDVPDAAAVEDAAAHAPENRDLPTDEPPDRDPERELAISARDEDDDAGGELRELADAMLSETERVLARVVARLRADADTASAHGQGDPQVQDHIVTFLADLAQCLTVIGDDGPEALQMLRDGSAIQQLIARRHGVQRARLRWSEQELRREYEILREELQAAMRRLVTRGGAEQVERAIGIVDHLLDRAERTSLSAFRHAG